MDRDDQQLRQRLAEVEERIDRIGKRFTAGYGSESDRDGWLGWLQELEAKRAELLAALGRKAPPNAPPEKTDP